MQNPLKQGVVRSESTTAPDKTGYLKNIFARFLMKINVVDLIKNCVIFYPFKNKRATVILHAVRCHIL